MAAVVLWGHALAALLFAGVAAMRWRGPHDALPRRAFAVAMALTALWALGVAGLGPHDAGVRLAEGLRDAGWLGLMVALTRRAKGGGYGLVAIYVVLFVLIALSAALGVAAAVVPDAGERAALTATRLILRMMVGLSALILIRPLAASARGGARAAVVAIGGCWGVDLMVATTAFAGGGLEPVVAARGVAMASLAIVLAVAADRPGEWSVAVSPAAARRSLAAIALAVYGGAMLAATQFVEAVGGRYARAIEAGLIVGATTTLATLLANPWLRGWLRVKVAKHLFRHRYDYREAWQRFSEMLAEAGGQPLPRRIVRAMAELTASPAGLLLIPNGDMLVPAASWNWRDDTVEGGALDYWRGTPRIVELDTVRAGTAPADEAAAVPPALLAEGDAWAMVPLRHGGELAGVVVLARPPVDRALDWEDFDLLRVAGRQAAGFLAEDRAHAALADAQRFDEFNRRFAFILHDIKNLVSGLSLVARNAERHADNPAFRADMIATLRESSDRMQQLLARLSHASADRPEPSQPVALAPLLARVARRDPRIACQTVGAPIAQAQSARLEALLGHLVQNALEASEAEAPVTLSAGSTGDEAFIEVIDRGAGMTAGFVRDELFRPFASTKAAGFGLGAFEARQLVAAMAGRLSVDSRVGLGTTFRIVLPAAPALAAAA